MFKGHGCPPSGLSNMACATLFINPNIDDQSYGQTQTDFTEIYTKF